nr:protein rogdi isoform X4 [Vespula vulgaris]
MRTSIVNEHPWKLQQIQDAANHLQQAIAHIDNVDRHYLFKTSDEVMHVLGNILGSLQRSRTSLIVPRKKTIDDLIKSRNMKSLSPNLPENLAISFYIQSYKLVLAVYQLENAHGSVKHETQQAECSVPWLNDALVLLTIALQLCQRLKDKLFLTGIWVFAAVYAVCRDIIPPPENPEDTVNENGWSQFILNKVKQTEHWNRCDKYRNISNNIRMSGQK